MVRSKSLPVPMQRQGKNSKFNARITALVEKRRIPENSRCIFGAISHKTSYNGGNFRKKILLVKKNRVRSDFLDGSHTIFLKFRAIM